MTDLTLYSADQIADWLSQGTDMPAAPTTLYVALFDDTDTELSSDLQNGRVGVSAGTGWDLTDSGTKFDNAAEIDFGEATVDLTNVQYVRLYDSSTGGNALTETTLDSAPIDVSSGTRVFFEAGQFTFDIQQA